MSTPRSYSTGLPGEPDEVTQEPKPKSRSYEMGAKSSKEHEDVSR